MTSREDKAYRIIIDCLSESDKKLLAQIDSQHEIAKRNFAISIWTGIIDRHSARIAKMTEGEVVIRGPQQRESLAKSIVDQACN